jgi:hypothetical protein
MGTVPVVPSFPAGYAAQGAQLAELCTAITWLMSGKPLTRLEQTAAQTLTTATTAPVTWDAKIVDRDSGWSSGSDSRYTAQTPGYYLLAACVSFASNATGARVVAFQVTTGPNNPAGSGLTTLFGRTGIPAASGAASSASAKSLTPYLYDLDYVQVIAEQTSGGNLATAAPSYFTITMASG